MRLRQGVQPAHGVNEIERGILEECERAPTVHELAGSARLQELARAIVRARIYFLVLGLIASPELMIRRQMRVAVAIAVLLAVAGIKVAIGVSRNRPVSFLVLLAIVFSLATLFIVRGFRTTRGDRMLGDLRILFDALRGRAEDLWPSASTNELALLMAVFGLGAVSVYHFPFVKAFRRPRHVDISGGGPRTTSSCGGSSCGSSSSCGGGGSSCGGGGGCGGGGCGGCGDRDCFGLTWQPALAAGILANLDRIDAVEVIAEEQFRASSRAARALDMLAHQVPLLVHGVALGPASTAAVEMHRLDSLARLVDHLQPAFWSEHLACVRAGDIEIGHLAGAAHVGDRRRHDSQPCARGLCRRLATHGREHRHTHGPAGQRSFGGRVDLVGRVRVGV